MRMWWRNADTPPTLAQLFEAYRVCKKLLAAGFVCQEVRPKPGYENDMDPGLIRVVRVFGQIPTFRDREDDRLHADDLRRYCAWMDSALLVRSKRNLLSLDSSMVKLGVDIVRVRYLCDDVIEDTFVRALLRERRGWPSVTVEQYEKAKDTILYYLLRRFRLKNRGNL